MLYVQFFACILNPCMVWNFTDVLYCQHPGSLCAIRLQLPWGNDFLGVLWTEIYHSSSGTHCSANSSKSKVRLSINIWLDIYYSILYDVTYRRPHSKYWFGVWTIVQLLYIMAVNTSVSLLLCPRFTRTTLSATSMITVSSTYIICCWMYRKRFDYCVSSVIFIVYILQSCL